MPQYPELPQDSISAQLVVGAWTTQTFPSSTPLSTLKHLRSEIEELIKAEERGTKEDREEEAADCYLLLAGYAARRGFSLHRASSRKFEKNKEREWGTPNAEGFQEHI